MAAATPEAEDIAEAKAEDQGGQEFDALAKQDPTLDAAENRSGDKKEQSVQEVARKEQGGQEFEPLKPKRIYTNEK